MKKTLSPYKKFEALSDAAKEAVWRELDDPDIALKAKPMSPAMRKLWERAKRKGGRPKVGHGAKRVLISVERGLLDEVDSVARRKKMTRSEFFARGAKAMLAKAG